MQNTNIGGKSVRFLTELSLEREQIETEFVKVNFFGHTSNLCLVLSLMKVSNIMNTRFQNSRDNYVLIFHFMVCLFHFDCHHYQKGYCEENVNLSGDTTANKIIKRNYSLNMFDKL